MNCQKHPFRNYDKYARTDLACEMRAREGQGLSDKDGIDFDEELLGEISVSRLSVKSDTACTVLSKPKGRYITLGFPKPQLMTCQTQKQLEDAIFNSIRELILRVCTICHSALVVGLGNPAITSDSIGPVCASGITVTRQIKEKLPHLFDELCHLETSVLCPGVSGTTGFETADLIKSAVNIAKPDIVIAIDALAARSPERLACTVQLCDSGICPGSGVDNKQTSIDSSTLGVPVIALGVPTVVDSTALLAEMLDLSFSNSQQDEEQIDRLLSQRRGFFVTPKDIDLSLKVLVPIISSAIDRALSADC